MRVFQGIALSLMVLMAVQGEAETITATIKLRERTPVAQLAANVQDSAHERYGKYYTADEIRQASGPSDADYANLLTELNLAGVSVVKETKTHLWLTVSADSSVIENLFQTRLEHNANGKHRALAVAKAPVYMSLVESVSGLDNSRKAHPLHRITEKKASDPGGISPAQIKTAYGFDAIYAAGLTGKGQSISIATYDDFDLSDVQTYYSALGLSSTPTVDKVTFNGTPTANEDSAMETQLDTEFSGMIAPGATIHVFTSATNDDTGELQLFTAILDDGRSKVVNYSWGGCETGLDPSHQSDMDKVFTQAAAQGINILVASGDSGSDACGDGTTAADWPASNPNVVAVGGTTLTLSGPSMSETAWSGSGGGISALFSLPDYQSGLSSPYTMRSYPDVAFNADPNSGEPVYAHQNGTAQYIIIGGTSMATPQWAGFLTLVGEARANAGLPTLGFLNPQIYALNSSDMNADFNDITSGSNGAYSAGPGWDAVTGLGSMQASALLNQLAQTQTNAPPPDQNPNPTPAPTPAPTPKPPKKHKHKKSDDGGDDSVGFGGIFGILSGLF
jgi:kumamolisin